MCSPPNDNREGSQVRAVLINPADQQTEQKGDRGTDRQGDGQTAREVEGNKPGSVTPLYHLDLIVSAILK